MSRVRRCRAFASWLVIFVFKSTGETPKGFYSKVNRISFVFWKTNAGRWTKKPRLGTREWTRVGYGEDTWRLPEKVGWLGLGGRVELGDTEIMSGYGRSQGFCLERINTRGGADVIGV